MANSTFDETVSPFKTIGGKGSNIARYPSVLKFIPERSASAGCGKTRTQQLASNGDSPTSSIEWSRPSSVSAVPVCNEAILKWDEDDVVSWLHEIGFAGYEVHVLSVCSVSYFWWPTPS